MDRPGGMLAIGYGDPRHGTWETSLVGFSASQHYATFVDGKRIKDVYNGIQPIYSSRWIWSTASNGGSSNTWMNTYQSDYSGYTTWGGVMISGAESALTSTAKELANQKYLVRGVDLVKHSKEVAKLGAKFNIAGGVIGVVDNGIQSYNDFSNENYIRGSIQAGTGALYGAGLICMAIPGLQVIGGGLILAGGAVDLVEFFVELDY